MLIEGAVMELKKGVAGNLLVFGGVFAVVLVILGLGVLGGWFVAMLTAKPIRPILAERIKWISIIS
jgi:hypothetical protein